MNSARKFIYKFVSGKRKMEEKGEEWTTRKIIDNMIEKIFLSRIRKEENVVVIFFLKGIATVEFFDNLR